jgi:AhpD family alkylhydroperoxidase
MEIQREARDPYRAMVALDRAVGLDEQLHLLVKLRASLVNGCAYCIDLHSKEGLEAGESQERLFGLAAWAEAPYYSARERAALALTDAITLIAEGRVPDDVWEEAERRFEPAELAQLVWAITAINAWNRIGISTRMVPGT